MSILVEKPQIIHIVSEVLIIGALSYYFHQKNNTIMTVVNELTERVKIQDEIIHKHEQIITQLSSKIDQLILSRSEHQSYPSSIPKKQNVQNKTTNKKEVQHMFVEMPSIQIPTSLFFDNKIQTEPSSSKVEEINDEPIINYENTLDIIEEEELNEEELDAELTDELKDLEEN
jgi:hypothetical protein